MTKTGKYNSGDFVQLVFKPFEEYSELVINPMFAHFVSGKKLMVIEPEDEDGYCHLCDEEGKELWLLHNDIELWDGVL